MSGVRWGVNLPLGGLGLNEQRKIVEGLGDQGFSDVWTSEGGGYDGFTPLAAAAAWAPGLRLGTGVLPVQTRGPGVLAQTAASLAELGGSEVLLGVGSSVPAHVTALNGIHHHRPYAHVRDTVRFLKLALSGEPVTETYETFSVEGFQLRRRLPVTPKVVVGALRPGMVKLGLTEGDGVLTNILTGDDVPRVLDAAGPIEDGKEFAIKVFVQVTEDAGRARATGRRFLGWILNQAPYRAFHDWLGRTDALLASRERWDAGDPVGAGLALPDDLVDELWLHGSPETCRERIRGYLHPGVTSVHLYLAEPTDALHALIPGGS